MLRKCIVAFCLILLLVGGSIQAFAQTSSNPYSTLLPNVAPNVPQNLNTLMQGFLISSLSTVDCVLIGQDPYTPSHQCLGINTQTGMLQYGPSSSLGLLGLSMSAVSMTFNIPVYFGSYTNYLASNFHIFSNPAYADVAQPTDIGYKGLAPLLNIWVGMRNIAYVIFVIVFIVIGLAIMLRLKIDPRTVMTIQNQIPKIIIGILLVTFSFAIASVMVDLMYIVSYLIVSFFKIAPIQSPLADPSIVQKDPFNLSFAMFNNGGWFLGAGIGVGNAVGNLVQSILLQIPLINVIVFFFGLPGSILCLIPILNNCPAAEGLGVIIVGIVAIIVIISMLVALWKLWIALLKTFLYILFHIALAPLMILGALLPGSKMGFGMWFKGLLGNLLVYPAVIAVMLLGGEFARSYAQSTDPNVFLPPAMGNLGGTGPLGGNGQAGTNDIGSLIAWATFMVLPKVPEMVLKALKAEGTSGIGGAGGIGAALGVGVGAVGAGLKPVGRKIWHVGNPHLKEKSGAINEGLDRWSTSGNRFKKLIGKGYTALNPYNK